MHPRSHENDLGALLAALIEQEPAVVVVFNEAGCHVGEAVEPKVEALVHRDFPLIRFVAVSSDQVQAFAGQQGLFVFPSVVAWFGGKETVRLVRHFSIDELASALARPYEILFR